MATRTQDPRHTISPEPDPYPAFLAHLREITAWLQSGCSMKSVWRAYADRGAFPGSYRTFLRYCSDHGLAPRRGNEIGEDAAKSSGVLSPPQRPDGSVQKRGPLRGPKPVGSVLGRQKLYPPPLERPPGFIPTEED